MSKYELCVVVSAKLEDDVRTATVDKCKETIAKCGGSVTDVEEGGKRKLAYEIEKVKEAYYYFIHFDADEKAPADIEGYVRIMDNVLRFLCVKQDEA